MTEALLILVILLLAFGYMDLRRRAKRLVCLLDDMRSKMARQKDVTDRLDHQDGMLKEWSEVQRGLNLDGLDASTRQQVAAGREESPGGRCGSTGGPVFETVKDTYSGQGAVVEVGCAAGSRTAELVAGLRANARSELRGTKVYAYGRFVWTPSVEALWNKSLPNAAGGPPDVRRGESFLLDFEEQLGGCLDQVVIRAGDLEQKRWTEGKIEILAVDQVQTWSIAKTVLDRFFVRLIPGVSIVIFPQSMPGGAPWACLIRHKLKEHLEVIACSPDEGVVVVRLATPIPSELLESCIRLENYTSEEADAALEPIWPAPSAARERGA